MCNLSGLLCRYCPLAEPFYLVTGSVLSSLSIYGRLLSRRLRKHGGSLSRSGHKHRPYYAMPLSIARPRFYTDVLLIDETEVSMGGRFYDSYRPEPNSRPQRQAAVRNDHARSRAQGARVSKPSTPTQSGGGPHRRSSREKASSPRNFRSESTQSGGIPPRKSSFGSNKVTRVTRNKTGSKRVPDPLVLIEEERPPYHPCDPPFQPSPLGYDEPAYNYHHNICHDIHHQDHEATYQAHLHVLSSLKPRDRLCRAQNIYLQDPTARPILTLGRPTWSSPNLRMHLYNGTLHSHTSTIHSPRTRTRFLDWQTDLDSQVHPCWHGIDTYDLNPLTRQARQELVSGLPTRIMLAGPDTLCLLTRRPTLDILTPAERQQLIEWWESHHGRKVTTPTQRKFPWVRFGERHYLQRRAKQVERDRNQRLYNIGLLSPGTAEALRGYGNLHGDYQGRRRTGSYSLRREPTRESNMTVRTW